MHLKSSTGGQMALFWGQSYDSYDAATHQAVETARKRLPGKTLEWIEMDKMGGGFDDNGQLQFQIVIRVGYC